LSARTISLLFGKDRFQSFVYEWFKLLQSSTKISNDNALMILNHTNNNNNNNHLSGFNVNLNEHSILDLLEKVNFNLNIK
jgi:hypothetical protein